MAIDTQSLKTPPRKERPSQAKPRARRSLLVRLFSLGARLFTWYAIFVVLFRCPASLDACDATSPRLCKPYFHAKAAVLPRARLYYHTYAGPYVQVVQPYYDAVDRAVLTPSWTAAVRYGAPQVERARAAGAAHWQASVEPQVAKAQAAAAAKYQEVLAPHVAKIQDAVRPYYAIVRNGALQAYHNVFLTTYDAASPYAVQGATTAAAFTTNTVVPSSVWAWNRVSAFVDATVLPRLRVVYLGTVEPQLEKIGLKLSQYTGQKDGRKTLTLSSFTKPAPTVGTTGTAVGSARSAGSAAATTTTTAAPTTTPKSKLRQPEPIKPEGAVADETEERRTAREVVAEDLRAWQEKYAKAADEGAAEMEASIEAIARRMIRRNARTTGQGLVDTLQETITANLAALRGEIQAIVEAVRDGAATPADGEAQALEATRVAGRGIKERAQAVRAWRTQFTDELQDTVSRAAENHFQILASIRDLALQKIGMKWAWMDGITYKDWAKYHQLKTRFDEWEKDLEELIVSHPALQDAEAVSHELEDEAMALVETAVAELLRLREVAAHKIAAHDASDDFDSASTKAAAEAKAVADAEAKAAAAAAAAEAEAAATKAAAEAASAAAAAAEAATDAPEADADDDITAFSSTPATIETDTETVAVSEVDAADPVTEQAEATQATAATTSVVGTTTATDADEADATTAATLSPEEASALVADDEEEVLLTEASEGPAAAMGTTRPDEEDEELELEPVEPAAHLPVDEVVAADEVPLGVEEVVDEEDETETRTRTRTTTATATATVRGEL